MTKKRKSASLHSDAVATKRRILSSPFVVDEADYVVVQDLLMGQGNEIHKFRDYIRKMVTIQSDAGRRVCELRCVQGWTKLRPSIGQLRSLQVLNLGGIRLSRLPATIGNLGSLIKLRLYESKIKSLPRSIGKLQSLQYLNLSSTSKLKGLPDEIGNLGSLIRLNLQYSHIESLPSSIGRLQSLHNLNLSFTYNLKQLPDEIGNLGSLKALYLKNSYVESLSDFLEYALVCSRFRHRAAMAPNPMSTGWSYLLGNARRCFGFSVDGIGDLGLEEPDAIYRILADFRGPFVEAITRAHTERNRANPIDLYCSQY